MFVRNPSEAEWAGHERAFLATFDSHSEQGGGELRKPREASLRNWNTNVVGSLEGGQLTIAKIGGGVWQIASNSARMAKPFEPWRTPLVPTYAWTVWYSSYEPLKSVMW
jgi:hypothetical protein